LAWPDLRGGGQQATSKLGRLLIQQIAPPSTPCVVFGFGLCLCLFLPRGEIHGIEQQYTRRYVWVFILDTGYWVMYWYWVLVLVERVERYWQFNTGYSE
jgi:hypothetical protein